MELIVGRVVKSHGVRGELRVAGRAQGDRPHPVLVALEQHSESVGVALAIRVDESDVAQLAKFVAVHFSTETSETADW